MKLTMNILTVSLLFILMTFPAYAAETLPDAKPIVHNIALITIEATVENIDRQTRQVTLKDQQGEEHTFTLDEDAGKLDDIDTGDQVTLEYLESVVIQVFAPDEIEAGTTSEAVMAESKPGEKPAGLAVNQVSAVVTIENIDLENELVTLKDKNGESKTVAPQHPENLKKVKVGDMVKITYTQAIGFKVTEKPAAEK